MPIKPEQLQASLKRGIAPVYLLAGDEPLLVAEAVDAVRAAARGAGYSEREVLHADAGFNWGELTASGDSMALFADKRLIELRLNDKGPGAEGSKTLVEYVANAPADKALVVIAGRLDKSQRGSKWFKSLEGAGVAVYAWPIRPHELPGWIQTRARAGGLQLSRDAVEMLAAQTEGNLLACAQEIEKLALLHPGGDIDADALREAVADSARFKVFDLPDKALAGQLADALRSLQRLLEEGEPVSLIVWTLVKDLRLLYSLVHGGGRGADALFRKARVWQSRQALFRKAAQRLDRRGMDALMLQAARTDQVAKGAHHGDIGQELVKLTAGLATGRTAEVIP